MFIKTKLAHAVAMTLAGTVLSVASVSSAFASTQTMYNLSTGGGLDNSTNTTDPTSGASWALSGSTDGWNSGATFTPGSGTNTSAAKWAGTAGDNLKPLGFTGVHLNWAVEMTGGGANSGVISTYDSFSRYGVYADVDTAKGAWSDANNDPGDQGWRHDLDAGLFKSDVTGLVTLSAEGLVQSGTQFGFTIFKGMNTNSGYGHHGSWNAGSNATGITAASAAGGGSTLGIADIVAYSVGGATTSDLNTISFNALAGEAYTIMIGGYRNGSWNDTNDGYKLTVSQVPVPAAAWLMGTGLLGLAGMRRKNKTVSD